MSEYDKLNAADQIEYKKLFDQFSQLNVTAGGAYTVDIRNRGALDAAVNADYAVWQAQPEASARAEFAAHPGAVDMSGNLIQDWRYYYSQNTPVPPLTPLRALSLDIGYYHDTPSLWEKYAFPIVASIIGAGAFSAASTGAMAGETGYVAGSYDVLEAGAYGTDAAALTTANGVVNVGVASGIPELIAAPSLNTAPALISIDTPGAAVVGSNTWTTDTISAALNPSLIEAGESAGFLATLPSGLVTKAGEIGAGKIAAKYLGNGAAYADDTQGGGDQPIASGSKALLWIGGGLVGVFFIARFLI